MQLITLTAPNGHRERWEPCLAVHALELLYKYVSDPDGGHSENELAKQIQPLVGTDPQTVYNALVYARAVDQGLFHKLAVLTNEDQRNIPRVYFLLRSMDDRSSKLVRKQEHNAQGNFTAAMIEQLTDGKQAQIQALTDLAKLFLDGVLEYSKEGVKHEQIAISN